MFVIHLRSFIASMFLVLPGLAFASFHTFKVQEVYSNADGTVQYVLLKESSGANGQNFLGGHSLVSRSTSGTKTFPFPGNLPSSSTANKFVLMATQGFADLKIVTPDYTLPAGFVPVSNGSVAFADVDTLTYTALPADSTKALNRDLTAVTNSPTNFAGNTGTIPATVATATPFSATITAVGPINSQSLSWDLKVKSTDVKITGCRFLVATFANNIFMFSQTGVELFDSKKTQVNSFGPLSNDFGTLATNADLSSFVGADFYLGYGVSSVASGCLADMLSKGTFKYVYTIR